MIVVGYTADGFGRAALTHGVAEAKLRQTALLVAQLHCNPLAARKPKWTVANPLLSEM